MKKALLYLNFAAITLYTKAQMAPFKAGNIVVLYQTNTFSTPAPVILREYTLNGQLVQSKDLSSLVAPNLPCFLPSVNSSASEFGYISKSLNGQYISFAAYAQPLNTGDRVAALIKYDGSINSQVNVSLYAGDVSIPKGAVTDDGTGVWYFTGNLSGDTNHIVYKNVANAGTPVSLLNHPGRGAGFRQMNISPVDKSLYIIRPGSLQYFNGLPNESVKGASNLPPNSASGKIKAGSSRGFCFISDGAGGEILYMAVSATAEAKGAAINALIAGSTLLKLASPNDKFSAGNAISGVGIPEGTTIINNDGQGNITLSASAVSTVNDQKFYTAPATEKGIIKFYRSSSTQPWKQVGSFGRAGDNYMTIAGRMNGSVVELVATKFNTGNGLGVNKTNLGVKLTAGSNLITLTASNIEVHVGAELSGKGITAGTIVTEVNGNNIKTSVPATQSFEGVISISPTMGLPRVIFITDQGAPGADMVSNEKTIVHGIQRQALRGVSFTPVK